MSLPTDAARPNALTVQRGGPLVPPHPLAALVYGAPAQGIVAPGGPAGTGGITAGVPARVLHGAQAGSTQATEWWCSDAPVQRGQHLRVRWASDGHWLFGAMECEHCGPAPHAQPGAASLADHVEAAFREVYASLREAGYPHLLRVWNHLPQINDEEAGLERYRQFNLGRQRATTEAGLPAFEGAPAACALGTHSGPLCIRFLSSRSPSLAVENPRQLPAYRYPQAYGPASPSFSRAVLVEAGAGQLALLISGTASILGHATAHAADLDAQLRETLANLRAVIDAARTRCTAAFTLEDSHCTVNLRHPEHLPRVRAAFEAAVGPHSRAAREAVYLHTDVCRSDLLVEIEAHTWAPGRLGAA